MPYLMEHEQSSYSALDQTITWQNVMYADTSQVGLFTLEKSRIIWNSMG